MNLDSVNDTAKPHSGRARNHSHIPNKTTSILAPASPVNKKLPNEDMSIIREETLGESQLGDSFMETKAKDPMPADSALGQ